MYGNGPLGTPMAGLPATGAAFSVSSTLGLLVAVLTLLFAAVALVKIAPRRR